MVGACCIAVDDSDVPPACPATRHILDTAQTVGEMVDALRAHRGTACARCESTRDTVVSDRLMLSQRDAVCCGVDSAEMAVAA
jgi:hypothetical protein